ncbi:nucleotidyltransferase domain-containing protein [Alloalcanivorax mobilis]|uniref:nucleotidyltransferase domain-containing protein n=1 Tax=Alloalcanivorax mobilis TaxID=2019569 RepID=UPI000B5B3F7A|nr:nucleotidyltransferase domain-containing protein [Alloalcanivorax mobilis]ASK33631.1 hypothetical protein CEK62_04120 [Alcanivorax sp. N3-2A]
MALGKYAKIDEAREFTARKLASLRKELGEALTDSPSQDKLTVITTGSYGREEASSESDLDLYIIFDSDMPAEDAIPAELASIRAVVERHVPQSVGSTGTFGTDAVVSFTDMLTNIGGEKDSNTLLTRRMLFLLEGAWLYGESRFHAYQTDLLKKYMKPSSPSARIPRFLLNDIIRYYRTITTDFEYKVTEDGKSWGLRSTKLRFSRKVLYFGGIVVAAELAKLDHEEKLEKAARLFSEPVLQRIESVGGSERSAGILEIYEEFIASVSDPEIRKQLEKVEKETRQESDVYQNLRSLSESFSDALATWLTQVYPEEHPIHHALVF